MVRVLEGVEVQEILEQRFRECFAGRKEEGW